MFISCFFSKGISEGELLSGVMYIHSTRTLGVSEVCHSGKQVGTSNVTSFSGPLSMSGGTGGREAGEDRAGSRSSKRVRSGREMRSL